MKSSMEMCEAMAAELLAGRPPAVAVRSLADQWPPLAAPLAEVVEAIDAGGGVPAAWRRFGARIGAPEMTFVAAGWQVAEVTGQSLADALDRVAGCLRDEAATRRLVASELASARATGWVVAGLPVLALGMSSGMGANAWGFIFGNPIGLLSVAVGGAVLWLGIKWINRLARVEGTPRWLVEHHDDRDAPHRDSFVRRRRLPLSVLVAVAAWVFLGGVLGLIAAPVAGLVCWRLIGRQPPAWVIRERREAEAQLPHFVGLIAGAVEAGAPPDRAVAAACEAMPGALARRLRPVLDKVSAGIDPAVAWRDLDGDLTLAPVGRAMTRAATSGTSLVTVIERLADELSRDAHGRAEEQAKQVGVKASVPLGLCLLPAFVLIAIVPIVGGLLTSLDLGH